MDQNIYQTIKDRILFLEYGPGKILNEKLLADEFGVSRTPVREILSRLEWEGLVRIIPRTGTMVTEVEFRRMMDVFQVRVELEGLVGRLAAEQITEDHIRQIEAIADECRALFPERNRRALIDIDARFREVIYDAANNLVLKDMSCHLWNLTLRVWYSIFDRSDWTVEVQGMLDEIIQTNDVLARRKPAEAAQVRQGYLLKYLARIKDKF